LYNASRRKPGGDESADSNTEDENDKPLSLLHPVVAAAAEASSLTVSATEPAPPSEQHFNPSLNRKIREKKVVARRRRASIGDDSGNDTENSSLSTAVGITKPVSRNPWPDDLEIRLEVGNLHLII